MKPLSVVRHDWCVASLVGSLTALVFFVVAATTANNAAMLGLGIIAVVSACFVSMLHFNVRMFLHGSTIPLLEKSPILASTRFAFWGGVIYGACVSAGVTLAIVVTEFPTRLVGSTPECVLAFAIALFGCGTLSALMGCVTGIVHRVLRRT